ncbi:MAG: hypothetical protein WDN08_09010 [Rhizomicrobium sp.]
MKSVLVAAALVVGMLGATTGAADARPHHGSGWGHHRHCVAWGWRHHHRDRYCRRWGW